MMMTSNLMSENLSQPHEPVSNLPPVSIIIPYLDRAEHLKTTVAAWLAQVGAPRFEVIVASYASTLLPVAVEPPVRVVYPADTARQWNLASALNLGADASLGRVLCFTTADVVPAVSLLRDVVNMYDRACAWQHDTVLRGLPSHAESNRVVFVKRWLNTRMGGFDEHMMNNPPGWGFTFENYLQRLRLCANASGEVISSFDAQLVSFLYHDDEARGAPFETRDIGFTYRAHRAFSERQIALQGFVAYGST